MKEQILEEEKLNLKHMTTTMNKNQYKDWVRETILDLLNRPIWACKIRELKAEIPFAEYAIHELCKDLVAMKDKGMKMQIEGYIRRWRRILEDGGRQIKRFQWYTKPESEKTKKNDLDIERAKEFLIGDILNLKPTGKSSNREFYCCPLHNENTGSFVWYKNNNSWYCFGCGQGGDSVDIYQKLHEVDFIQAVKALT